MKYLKSILIAAVLTFGSSSTQAETAEEILQKANEMSNEAKLLMCISLLNEYIILDIL